MFIFNLFRFFFDLKDLKELKEKYDASNDKKVLFNKVIKDKLYTDIDQWDHFVDSSEFDDSIIDDISVNNLGLRKFANNIWSQFKQNAVREWQIMKKEENRVIDDNTVDLINSKLFTNFKVIQAIILRHYNENNIVFFLFILNILINLQWKVIQNIDIMSEFTDQKVVFLKEEFREMKDFDSAPMYQNQIISEQHKNVSNEPEVFKKILKILYILDYLASQSKSYRKSLNDLLYLFNFKIKVHQDYIDKSIEIITKDDYENYYTTLLESPENLDKLISIDGSASKGKVGGGFLTRYDKGNGIQDQERFCFEVKDYKEYNNVAGELFSLIGALEFAIEKNWKEVNIVFDYVGVVLYTNNAWSSKDDFIFKVKQKIRFLIAKSKIKINWYKVYSHTNVRLNEEADFLAKVGSGISKASAFDLFIPQPKLTYDVMQLVHPSL